MKQTIQGFILSIQFLTRIPIPIECPWEKGSIKGALSAFAIVGLIIGSILALTLTLTESFIPAWMVALVLITLWVFLTGGLHLDGLMDVADAVGSNAPLERKREIMKDPQVGSFAALTIIFHLVWKFALLFAIISQQEIKLHELVLFIILIPACSRLVSLYLLYHLPVMKQEGLAFQWKQHIGKWQVGVSTIIVLLYTLIFPQMLIIFCSYIIFFLILRSWIMKHFKGINGDVLGASIEGGELWGLFILWMYTWFVMG